MTPLLPATTVAPRRPPHDPRLRPGAFPAREVLEMWAREVRGVKTRRAYVRACERFLGWCEARRVPADAIAVDDIAAYADNLGAAFTLTTVRLHLAAIGLLGDRLVARGLLAANPAAEPVVASLLAQGEPILKGQAWRDLVAAMPSDTLVDARDRALVAALAYSTARSFQLRAMRVCDVRTGPGGVALRLAQRRRDFYEVEAPAVLAHALAHYIRLAEIGADAQGWLFRRILTGTGERLSTQQFSQNEMCRTIRRRALAARIVLPAGWQA